MYGWCGLWTDIGSYITSFFPTSHWWLLARCLMLSVKCVITEKNAHAKYKCGVSKEREYTFLSHTSKWLDHFVSFPVISYVTFVYTCLLTYQRKLHVFWAGNIVGAYMTSGLYDKTKTNRYETKQWNRNGMLSSCCEYSLIKVYCGVLWNKGL